MTDIISKLRKFFLSRTFMLLVALIAGVFVSLGAEVASMVFFAVLIAFILIVCDDIVATTLPFLLLCASVLQCYNFIETNIKGNEMFYISLGIPVAIFVVFAFFYHFIKYRQGFKIGKSFYGIVAVAVAVTFGGIGSISAKEYFGGASLYYIAGLGIGMVVCYLLIKSQLEIPRDYDLHEKFSDIMCIAGLFLCFFMVEIYIENFVALKRVTEIGLLDFVKDPEKYVWTISGANEYMLQPGNNISTMLMLFMPFAFFKAAKSKKHIYHLITAFLMLATIVLSRSRGGIYLGTVEFVLCLVAYSFMAKDKASKIVGWSLVACAAAVGAFAVLGFDLVDRTKAVIDALIKEMNEPGGSESRVGLLVGAIENFKESPIFGKGLGFIDPELMQYYSGKTGTIQWYHMMIPQIIGSMGIVGVLAYGYQIIGRISAVIKKFSPYVLTLGLSYLGMLLMSQVNPGEFCPLPYELMVVMLFILIEKEPDREKSKKLIKGE